MTSLPLEETKVQDERRKTKILKMMENIWQLSSFFFIFSVADEKPTKNLYDEETHSTHVYNRQTSI